MMMVRLAVGMIALSGCGDLISSNITTYDLDLPAKSFSVDASGWQVTQTAADQYLEKTCASTPMICATAATNACGANCSGSCDMTHHTCDLGLEISVHQTIDLVSEKPELKSVDGVLHVTVDAMMYEVVDNSLNIATPPLSVYVAPMSVMDPDDPMAKLIATIDPVMEGTPLSERSMVFVEGGQDTLTATLSDFKNPFNVIVGGTLMLASGDAVPKGKLDANVHIKAHASP